MASGYVTLTEAVNPLQRGLIEDILQGEEIPFRLKDSSIPAIFGTHSPVGTLTFEVAEGDLQRAKDSLCAQGVVCDVSERLLRRTLDEVVKPLVNGEGGDPSRLHHLLSINNKETVRALYEQTFELPKGREFLENLFFELAAGEDSAGLPILARVLAAEPSAGFLKRYGTAGVEGNEPERVSLLDALPGFSLPDLQLELLSPALLDASLTIREAGSEALFSIVAGVVHYDYDPEGDAESRTAFVQTELPKLIGAR